MIFPVQNLTSLRTASNENGNSVNIDMMPKCICSGGDEVACVGAIPPVIFFAGRLLNKPFSGGQLFRCWKCNVAFRYPQPDKKILDELYRQGKSDNWQRVHSERQDWKIASTWITQYLKYHSAVLDVGCFDGGFLKALSTVHDCFGIEIHEAAGKNALENGIQIIGKDFADLTDVGITFDAVTSFDVIEHTQNPLEFLRQMAKVTKSGGIVIVSTGNCDTFSWRLMGSRYWYCTIGEHMSFISPKWCEWAGNQLGLELKQVIKFSHASTAWRQRVEDVVKNLLYAASPRGFARLRQMGLGGAECRAHKEMLMHPPSWMSAKDHFICVFEKNVP